MASGGLFGFRDLLKNFSSSISDSLYNYFVGDDYVQPQDYEDIEESLAELYGDSASVVTDQALAKLKDGYHGNTDKFMIDFFYPAINLLTKLKKNEQKHLVSLQAVCSHGDKEDVAKETETDSTKEGSGATNTDTDTADGVGEKTLKESNKAKSGVANTDTDTAYGVSEKTVIDNTHDAGNHVDNNTAATEEDCDKNKICENCEKCEELRRDFGACWPLVYDSKIVVNFADLSWKKFQSGDAYFYVRQSDSGEVELWVKLCSGSFNREICVQESDFGRVFTMEWKDEVLSDSTQDLTEALHRCLVSLHDSIVKLRWEDIVPSTGSLPHNQMKLKQSHIPVRQHGNTHGNTRYEKKDKNGYSQCSKSTREGAGGHGNKSVGVNASMPANQQAKERTERSGPHKTDSRAPGSCSSDGREMDSASRSPPPSPGRLHQHRHLEPPKTILDVDYKLLQSGVTILPGCRDLEGNAVVLIFTSSSLWKNQQIASTDLTRLIMYYHSIPRETVRCRGLTVVADIRGCTTSTINTLLESLYLLEGNIPQAISVVHLLSDKHTQSLVLKSPIYDVHASFQIDLLLSPHLLSSYISTDQLPPVLEGTFQYNHDDWIRFHMRLDPFLASCRSVAKYLVNIIQELSVVDQVPASAQEASTLVDHHENIVKVAFEDPRVKRLQNEGDAMLNSLEREEVNIGHTDDYRYAMEDISRLYKHVQEAMVKLMRLSDNRLNRLEKCMQLKEFDEECNKIISWLHMQGNECLQRHLAMADNLKGIRAQQRDFEKFYYAAMTHIEKGNDLLEDASVLAQSGDFDEVTGYKELARMLKRHLQQFSERLEETRERIEATSKCYQLLDKTYEWALEAMKYVASMKMEHCATPEGLEKLVRSLDLYLAEHPAIAPETFQTMLDLASQVNNDKLLEQCQTAQNRCIETQKMLTLRGHTLRQFKEQIESNSPKVNSSSRLSTGSRYSPSVTASRDKLDSKTGSSSALSVKSKTDWEPKDTSTPVVPKTYSRTQVERTRSVTSLSSSSSSSYTSSPIHMATSPSSPCHLSDSPCHSGLTSPAHSLTSPAHSLSSPLHMGSDPPYPETSGDSNSYHGASNFTNSLQYGAISKDTKVNAFKENMISENKLIANQMSTNTSMELHQVKGTDSGTNASRSRPARKILKRAVSTPNSGLSPPIMEEDSGNLSETQSSRVVNLRQNGRTDSMITGSSDSLPSLPEEDEGIQMASPVSTGSSQEDGQQLYMRPEWTPVPVNTHLLDQSAATTPLRPLADLKLTEEEIKSRRTLSLVMSEMLQTERDYVCALRFVVENYVPEMEREDVPQALRGKRNVVFGNLEKIYAFHQQYFLQEMEASRRNPFLLAKYFLMHENQFHLYTLYNKNKPKSDAMMAEYGKHFFKQKQQELGDKMDLASYLLKPVQRMGKYALMLRQVMKECPPSAPEYADLRAAEEMVRFQLRHGNDLLAMDALKECDVNLQEQGRLLRQDEFLVYHGRRKFMRHVFLFEDLVLFSKTRRSRSGLQDTYLYKYSFKMSDIGVTADYESSGYKFELWWRRRNSGDSYILQAPSSDLKKCWVKDITRILWNQAIRNRENRLSELASMGIGNKPCLDIKPSSDNIHDRFINIAVGGREARTRNSIAVCSTDHLTQGNKRPHSIISVSSTSSSNSSQSGLNFGAMNLAFNPMDSPRTYRRSLTFMSSESGIGTSIASGGEVEGDPSRAQSPPPYAEVLRSRAMNFMSEREFGKVKSMNLPSHSEEVTDI